MSAPGPDDGLEAIRSRYEVVVGVEVHAQLATRTKLFCGCAPRFGDPPNTHTCPVCLGLPGALPVLGREAFEIALACALALGCEIPGRTSFDRKSYFYPDQPKGYQISQSYAPVGTGGALALLGSGKRVEIDNVHLEEDAGKLLHDEAGGGAGGAAGQSVVDLNRSGVPLAEIVTTPCLRSLAEVQDYMETLRLTLLHLGLSRCRMEEGNLRFEASISLRPHGQAALGDRVEVKNLNSTKAVLAALRHEAVRQAATLDQGQLVERETRLWDEARQQTRRMRSKEEAHDYRYLPEPDLAPVRIDAAWREAVRAARVGELPSAKRQRYEADPGAGGFGLGAYEADVLTQSPAMARYFEGLAGALGGDGRLAARWVLNDVLAQTGLRGMAIEDLPVAPEALADLVRFVEDGTLSAQAGRTKVLPAMIDERQSAAAIVEAKGLRQQSDRAALMALVEEVLAANGGVVEQVLAGKPQAIGFLVGQCMKRSRGRGNPKVVKGLLEEALAARRGGGEASEAGNGDSGE